MIRIRPYNASDANIILSWCPDEKAFYQWTAGVLGNYPITQNEFAFVESLMPFTAFDETGIVGFFTLRNPNKSLDELRFVFELYGARKATLGVFENNLPAYYCYKAVGFRDIVPDITEKYCILGEEWKCRELMIENI